MNKYTVVKCRMCGKLMTRYPWCVYKGDSTCCGECNQRAQRGDKPNYYYENMWKRAA